MNRRCFYLSAESVSVVSVIRGLPRPGKKFGKLKKYTVHNFQNAHQARTGRNMVKSSSPNAPSTWLIFLRPRTHAFPQTCHHSASSFLAVRIICALSQCFVQKATRRMEKSVNTHNRLRYFLTNKIFFLQVMYRYARTYDLHCKVCNNNRFFRCLCSALMEKPDFYCSVIPWNCTWYCTV